MKKLLKIFLVSSLLIATLEDSVRKKRYVVFPEGSSFSIALCMTMHTLTPENIFTEGMNWGISYDLPNESRWDSEVYLPRPKSDDVGFNEISNDKNVDYDRMKKQQVNYKQNYHYMQRRYRRDLYNKLEVVIDAMGYDGRTCILRALCEASQTLMPKGNTLIEEMMRIVFSLPLKRMFSFEPAEHRTYAEAHKAGYGGRKCENAFPGCSFSLIDMALGKYNAMPYNADNNKNNDDNNIKGYVDSNEPGMQQYMAGSRDATTTANTKANRESSPSYVRYTMK